METGTVLVLCTVPVGVVHVLACKQYSLIGVSPRSSLVELITCMLSRSPRSTGNQRNVTMESGDGCLFSISIIFGSLTGIEVFARETKYPSYRAF
jgi:hypothetical protein